MSAGCASSKEIELAHLARSRSESQGRICGAQKGAQSDAEARSKAAGRIARHALRQNDYFWINDMHQRW